MQRKHDYLEVTAYLPSVTLIRHIKVDILCDNIWHLVSSTSLYVLLQNALLHTNYQTEI